VVTSYHVNPETGHVEVRGVSRDITEREQARWALQVAEQRFRALFLASPLPIIVLDRDARVRLWSPAAEAMFGWKAAEVLGRASPVLLEEQQTEMLQYLERVLAGETIRSGEPRQCQRKDGSLVDV
jgi:PAS domain S-box-containing protein